MGIFQGNKPQKVHLLTSFIASIFAITTFLAGTAMAQTNAAKNQQQGQKTVEENLIINGIGFGNNSSDWANDGECDDPRFVGIGTAVDMDENDLGRDANDCSSLFLAGDISLKPAPADIVADIDFGNNSSDWADNQICDDPRFGGPGTDELLLDEDIGRDANDCKSLFLAGDVTYLGDDPNMEIINFDGILFGDNTGKWANDEECDDPRFVGNGMAVELVNDDLERDANDCLALYQNGSISLVTDNSAPGTAMIDFGDDSSEWANDGECDDPRFAGNGSADVLLDEDLARDATDCRQLFETGQIYLNDAPIQPPNNQDIYFGNNTSEWANDGECDDPRFIGDGMASQLNATDVARDATDCKTLLDSGEVELISAANLDFGDDSSEWPNDGECDDPRFGGPGTAVKLDPQNFGRDATDCQNLLQSGQIEFIGGVLAIIDPATLLYGGEDGTTNQNPNSGAATINWGDDSSRWANDGECDDPRFSGTGSASTLLDEDLFKDATDCRTLYEAGQIQLDNVSGLKSITSPKAIHATNFDFGNNDSDYANNGICDDPRFGGPGSDPVLLAKDIGRDANDCRALFESAQVSLVSDIIINFGDNSGEWASDGECDDPRFAGKAMAAELVDEDLFKDANDCRTAFERGKIYLIADGQIDFGDNTSEWANDEECDDLRFAGPGAAGGSAEEDLMRDANDCRSLYRTGQLYLLAGDSSLPALAFGDNSSEWASDGECDDPRFGGPGSAQTLLAEDLGHDAVDCRALFDAGQIELLVSGGQNNKVKGGGAEINSPVSAIDFGDDSSEWANDGECDDPRFEGQGVAATLLDADMGRDASDCAQLFVQGKIQLAADDNQEPVDSDPVDSQGAAIPETQATPVNEGELNFGDDSSIWANDGECDDPRFAGPGAAPSPLSPLNLLKDASDCQSLYESGEITII